MKKQDWTWMPHAAHFSGRQRCLFHLATHVGGFIVSSVGDYRPDGDRKPVGGGFDYETMVFVAEQQCEACCPWEIASGHALKTIRTNDPGEAVANHMRLCHEYATLSDRPCKPEANSSQPFGAAAERRLIEAAEELARAICHCLITHACDEIRRLAE